MGSYKIIRADIKKHSDDIISLKKRNLPEDTGEAAYRWSYEDSPYGPAECLIAVEESSNRTVGAVAVFPRKIYVEGEAFCGGIAGDFSVDKEHRVFGPALKLQKEITSGTGANLTSFIYGIPNEASQTVFRRVGYTDLGAYNRYIKILKANYKSNKQLFNIKRFGKLVDFGLKISSRETGYKRPPYLSIECPGYFNGLFDVFWNNTLNQFHNIGERNSRFLNWRYVESPARDYKIFTLVKDGKDIAGYVVYYILDNMCHIADLMFVRDEGILESLLSEFIIFMRGQDIGSIDIRYFGSNFVVEHLKRFNFYLHKEATVRFFIFIRKSKPSKNDLLKEDNWHFLEGDTDE